MSANTRRVLSITSWLKSVSFYYNNFSLDIPLYCNVYNIINQCDDEDKVMEEKQLFIGELARQIGINPKTVRYYEDINLLPKSKRGENNYRIYSKDTLNRLIFIKKAQSLGFTLREIKEILSLRERGLKPCSHVRDLSKQRIADIEQKITELTTLRHELKKLEDEWTTMQIVEDDIAGGICPQIEKVTVRSMKKPSMVLNTRK